MLNAFVWSESELFSEIELFQQNSPLVTEHVKLVSLYDVFRGSSIAR